MRRYKCPKCGTIFEGELLFCPACNQKMRYRRPVENSYSETSQQSQKEANEKSSIETKEEELLLESNIINAPEVKTSNDEEVKKEKAVKKAIKEFNVFNFIRSALILMFFLLMLFLPIFLKEVAANTYLGFSLFDYVRDTIVKMCQPGYDFATFYTHLFLFFIALDSVVYSIIAFIALIKNFVILVSGKTPTYIEARLENPFYHIRDSFNTISVMVIDLIGLSLLLYFPYANYLFDLTTINAMSLLMYLLLVAAFIVFLIFFIIRWISLKKIFEEKNK